MSEQRTEDPGRRTEARTEGKGLRTEQSETSALSPHDSVLTPPWCNTCWRPQPCPCLVSTGDIDAWCTLHLGNPAMEAEYRRREQQAQAMLERTDRESWRMSWTAMRCGHCLEAAPPTPGGLCPWCERALEEEDTP